MNALIQSLNFLRKIGLFPVVVHGGGPQLNAELAAANEPAEYVEGLRVTPPSVLAIAQRVFARENLKIVDALEASGTRARPITQGVYIGTPLDPATYGFVGAVSRIQTDALANAISGDYVPVVSSLAMTETGQVLNINADVAALELAKALRPLKIVFVNVTAGMRDGDGKVMRHIVLDEQYDGLMKQPWVKHGTKLKLKEFKSCLDVLPPATSITITSPGLLQKELFSRNGGGTTVEKGSAVLDQSSSSFCFKRLSTLLGISGQSPASIKQIVQDRKLKVFVNASYSAGLVLSPLPSSPSVYHVDHFAFDRSAIDDESADSVLRAALSQHPSLIWNSAPHVRALPEIAEALTSWFKKVSQGYASVEGSEGDQVYWTGIPVAEIQRPMSLCLGIKSAQLPFANLIRNGSSPSEQAQLNVNPDKKSKKRIGLLGARGFTGGHLVRLIGNHDNVEMVLAASSTNFGKPVTTEFPHLRGTPAEHLLFSQVTADNIAKYTSDNGVDGWFMALPDQVSRPYVEALDGMSSATPQPVLVDLSADHRFDSTWVYGSPETNRAAIRGARRIANPGCYATGMYLTLYPLVRAGLIDPSAPPACFGVSGYSGAGSKPSDKNDTKRLADNLLPYKLIGHTHEREVTHQLGGSHPLFFTPHVGQFFQGITVTSSMKLTRAATRDEIISLYKRAYENEPLVRLDFDNIPEVKSNANKHTLTIGGLTVEGNHMVAITTLDNLLKGAATQAIQNMNLCFGLDELSGIKNEL
uniref:acetylglutamate kinase n=1 Tax=Cavenderia deminutiva TaxID=361123 RepID=A0A1L2FV04_9MYCE|nr:arginine [Cavenderia deminutiva]